MDKLSSNEISEREASQIAANMGIGVDKIANRAGIGKTPTNQVNVQNNVNMDEHGNPAPLHPIIVYIPDNGRD